MADATFKAVIDQNQYGRYVVTIQRHYGPGYVPTEVGYEVTYTLKGARKKAIKMLAKARRDHEFPKLVEEIQ